MAAGSNGRARAAQLAGVYSRAIAQASATIVTGGTRSAKAAPVFVACHMADRVGIRHVRCQHH